MTKAQQLSLIETIILLHVYFDNYEKIYLWLNTENPNLGNIKPIHMIFGDRGNKLISFIKVQLDGSDEL